MTENEAIKQLQVGYLGDTEDLVQAKHIAIKALEEIKQYRAIGLTPELIEAMQGHNVALINDLGEYQAIGTVEDIQMIFQLCKDLQVMCGKYHEIGTVEEFKALKEKNTPYKPKEYEDRYYACKCDNILLPKWRKYPTELMPKSEGLPHCMACGQKLDWQ